MYDPTNGKFSTAREVIFDESKFFAPNELLGFVKRIAPPPDDAEIISLSPSRIVHDEIVVMPRPPQTIPRIQRLRELRNQNRKERRKKKKKRKKGRKRTTYTERMFLKRRREENPNQQSRPRNRNSQPRNQRQLNVSLNKNAKFLSVTAIQSNRHTIL